MGLFEHHPARTGALRSAGSDSFAAAKQLSSFADEVRGVSTAVPLAVEGTSLVDAARQPLRQVDRRALALVPVFRLQGKAARLWADAVDDFNWRVDMLNDIWDQANPSAWQKVVVGATVSPTFGLLSSLTGGNDEADARRTELKRELTKRHAQLEDQLEVIGDNIAKTLDAGPGPGVDAFYRFMTEAMSKAKAQRRAAERKLSTFGDDSWDERLKHSIGGGMIAAVMGMADAVVMATPFAPGTTSRYDVPTIPAENMPSRWWDRTARELGLDARGPAYNLAELSTLIGGSLIPMGGPAKSISQSAARLMDDTGHFVPGGGLRAHETAGGHTLARHVGRSDADLLARLREKTGIQGASSFSDPVLAERAVAKVIHDHHREVSEWVAGTDGKLTLTGDAGQTIGRHVRPGSEVVKDVSGVRVVIVRDPSLPTGYRILTSFPTP